MAVTRRNPDRPQMVKRAHDLRDEGMGTNEIARLLGLSPSTVGNYFLDPTGERGREYTQRYNERLKQGLPIQSMSLRSATRQARIKEARAFFKKGMAVRDIADKLGVTASTVSEYLHDPTRERKVKRERFRRTGVYRTREEAEVAFNRMDLPLSTKIRMRPVWKRRQRRIYGQNALPPPSDDECRDAIRILGNRDLQRNAPALYFDAFLILDEGGK